MIFSYLLTFPPIACNHLHKSKVLPRGALQCFVGQERVLMERGGERDCSAGRSHQPGPSAEQGGVRALRAPAGETRVTGSASITACWEKAILTKGLFIILFTKS